MTRIVIKFSCSLSSRVISRDLTTCLHLPKGICFVRNVNINVPFQVSLIEEDASSGIANNKSFLKISLELFMLCSHTVPKNKTRTSKGLGIFLKPSSRDCRAHGIVR